MMTAEQLKDSILQLALQGKLVEQRADEGSARELLSLLSQSKKEYLLNNPVRKMKDANGIDLMETDAEIPDTWRWVKLQDVCLVVFSGKSPVYDKTSTIFKCIGQANNQENGLSLSSIKYVTENFHNSVPEYMFLKKGDVLLNTLGGGTVGRSGIVDMEMSEYLTDGHIFVIRTIDICISKYILYFLKKNRNQIERKANGSTNQSFLKLSEVINYLLPLPPKKEIERIVAKIEELMPFVDQYAAASTKLNMLNATFPEMMKKSILQEAVQGKLVPQDPNDEPASVLLKKIAEEKKRLIIEGKIKKQKPLPEITEDEIPFDIPESWEWVRFTDIAETCLGKMLDKTKNKGTFFPYIRNVNVRWGEFDVSDLLEMKFDDEGERFLIRRGDLVVCEGGEPGRCAVWNSKDSIRFQKALHRIRFISDKIEPMFYYYVLRFYTGSGYLARFFTGTTIKHLPGDKLNKIIVPFPPIGEQKRIVQEILRYNPYLMMLAQ